MALRSRQTSWVRCWTHEAGAAATADAIGNILKPAASFVVKLQDAIYSSMDMRAAIDVEEIQMSEFFLKHLLSCDDRGGYFSQADVQEGMLKALTS